MNFFFDHCCFKFPLFICRTTENEKKHSPLTVNRSIINERTEENSKTNEFVNSSFYSSINSSSIDPPIESNEKILIKEIILTRSSPYERLGLTLCYGLTSTLTTNVYIQQIDENSLASRQGQFRPGDQIIEMNYQPVVSRDQAMNIVRQSSRIHFRIVRLENLTTNDFIENDSGVIIHSPTTDLDTTIQPIYSLKKSNRDLSSSLSCLNRSFDQYLSFNLRHCSSLNDLRCLTIDEAFLKPLPFQSNNIHRVKNLRRRYREQRLKEQYQMLITTDEETMSEFKQGKYWSRQQRKEHLIKSKQNRQRRKKQSNIESSSATDDFHLLNRIFLRENQREFKEKPHLATKFYYESLIEKENLKKFLQKNHFQHRTSKSLFI